MSENIENIELLVVKFNEGSISSDELKVLIAWYNSHDDRQANISTKKLESQDEVKSRMLAGLLARVEASKPEINKSFSRFRWISAAAAIVLTMLATWIVFSDRKPEATVQYVKTTIEPGGNKATLTLPNGKTIVLSSSQSGIVTGEKITYKNGLPVKNADVAQAGAVPEMLALHTPLGGTYQVTLPDGTEVWLNAGTTIKYPSRFSADARVVHLQGEAFFKVKTIYQQNGEKIPFKVVADHQEVEVLGTQFNMNAYPEKSIVKTTLVEGKVAISDNSDHLLLLPNQQAVTTAGKTKIKRVNVYNYTAWRDGKFSFDGKTFEETMDEVARWYDLRIVYEREIPHEELTGDAFRNQNIHFVLRLLDVAEINYNLDVSHRQLTIKGTKNRM